MDLNGFKRLRPALEADLKAVFEKHGLAFQNMNGRIGSTESELKIKVSDSGVNPAETRWNEVVPLWYKSTLKVEWLGKSFRMGGKSYTIKGLLNRPRTDKVVSVYCQNDGKEYVVTPEVAKAYMDLAA